MRTLLLVVAATATATLPGCKGDDRPAPSPTATATAPAAVIDITDPASCRSCHPAIVDEWEESMHARSHHSRDPIYAGIRAIRVANEGEGITRACAGCHTPGFEDDPEAAAAAVGVGCATCHNTRVGAAHGQLLGPNDVAPGASPAHGTGPGRPELADGTTICQGCHESLESPHGLTMCATGAEHAELPGDARQSCASCHMPRVPGAPTITSSRRDHATHAFLGPHRAWYQDDPSFLASAIELSATLARGALRVEVKNRTGHAFPTGFPARVAQIACVGRDRAGREVWRCEPRALGKRFVDAEGKPALAFAAAALAADTRIPPAGTDVLEAAPPPAVVAVEVTVAMRLVPEPLAARLGLAEAPEGEARTIATVTASRADAR